MRRFLGFLSLIVILAFAGAAVACSMHESASVEQGTVTASAPAGTSTGTTTPKTPEVNTGG
jgi:hypothetical protein